MLDAHPTSRIRNPEAGAENKVLQRISVSEMRIDQAKRNTRFLPENDKELAVPQIGYVFRRLQTRTPLSRHHREEWVRPHF